MKHVSVLLVACAIAIGTAAVPASAHHSAVMFDDQKFVEMQAVVKEFQFASPHVWLIVVVPNTDGTSTTWGFEGPSPLILMRNGIKKSDFPPGTAVKIKGHPMRDGRTAASWNMISRDSDGKIFYPLGPLANSAK
jgi:hypothetical protein